MNVLSVQSFVAHGYVGNKCSMLALQTLGMDVDAVNTVQLSNHTGYPSWRGQVFGAPQLAELFRGMRESGVAQHYTHVLTGYCRDAAALREIAGFVAELRSGSSSSFVYLLDPVMGDDGKLYVPEEVVGVYRDAVIGLADVVKLNQTEAETLTGVKIRSLDDAATALERLHAMGPRTAVLSSCSLPSSSSAGDDDDVLHVVGSGSGRRWAMAVPRIRGYFSGTGDLFSALLLAWTARGDAPWDACAKTVATIQAVLARTVAAGSRELLLVQSRHDIEFPPTPAFEIHFF